MLGPPEEHRSSNVQCLFETQAVFVFKKKGGIFRHGNWLAGRLDGWQGDSVSCCVGAWSASMTDDRLRRPCVCVYECEARQLRRQWGWPSRSEISRPVWLHGAPLLLAHTWATLWSATLVWRGLSLVLSAVCILPLVITLEYVSTCSNKTVCSLSCTGMLSLIKRSRKSI